MKRFYTLLAVLLVLSCIIIFSSFQISNPTVLANVVPACCDYLQNMYGVYLWLPRLIGVDLSHVSRVPGDHSVTRYDKRLM